MATRRLRFYKQMIVMKDNRDVRGEEHFYVIVGRRGRGWHAKPPGAQLHWLAGVYTLRKVSTGLAGTGSARGGRPSVFRAGGGGLESTAQAPLPFYNRSASLPLAVMVLCGRKMDWNPRLLLRNIRYFTHYADLI